VNDNFTTSRILIVDDQPANTNLLENFLKINGFKHYLSTNDSREVQHLVREFKPDLLLLDIMMPHISGIEILAWLNETELLNSPMRVMVLTADITKETLKEVLSSGAHDMMRKPFDFVELELRLKNLLHANELMKQLNDQSLHLASLVEERTAELSQKNEELEQFIYVASHDTQEPLRMITGFLQLLEKKYSGQIDEKGKQYIHFAVDGAARMKTLIKDMLEFSRAGKLSRDDLNIIDLNEILQDVILGLQRLIDQTGTTISFQNLPKVEAISAPVRQIIQNLIINAITYQSADQQPIIEINSSIESNGEIKICISDNGIGISEENQKKIFDIFSRLHTKDDHPGSGMGLSISKKLMERMGGTISVKSSPKNGSIFCLHFPSSPLQ
jgi:signal transduction histidine kinase